MTERDLDIIKSLMIRTENLPDILHLRAAPVGYELTKEDKELLLDVYEKLDDIIKEVAAFINVKFPGRQDYIQPWNNIDFDPKIAGIKIATTDREHTKSAWKRGLYDLKSLIKSLIIEVTLLVDDVKETKSNPFLDDKELEKYYDDLLEKRADQADFFIDMIIEKKLINLDKSTIRKYFKKWFNESQDFDLQVKDGDFTLEDGDIQTLPDFNENNISEFLKWFEKKGNKFIDYLIEQGVNIKRDSKELIINTGNMIINKESKIKTQTLQNGEDSEESTWSKANVIIALVVGIATIVGILWQIFS